MKNELLRKALICCLILNFSMISLVNGAPVLGDRILFEINNSYFTQRQLEVYLLIKEALRKRAPGQNVTVVSKKTWQAAMKSFETDMLIQQEVQKFGSFLPSKEISDKTIALVERRNQNDSVFQNAKKRLAISRENMVWAVSTILQIQAFRKNKNRGEKYTRQANRNQPAWLEELRLRMVIRKFKGADTYVQIVPAVAKKVEKAL